MEETLVCQIRRCIEEKIQGGKKFIIFPFGDVGMQVKHVLNEVYGIQEGYILDNNLCRYNPQIHELSFLSTIDCKDFFLILACTNADIYMNLKLEVEKYFNDEDIVELSSMSNITRIGKHSYGSLCCNHMLIESIGAFCSFAIGSEVVFNHEMRYITTSPIIYIGAEGKNTKKYEWYKNAPWYVEGLCPKKEKVKQFKRIRIGNDVWLGHNVLITNYSNIGNGVIAGAGSVITKDVPDYAIVAGVPARIIRYRYTKEEINCMNQIAWWNWSDQEIRERYDDFYLPVQEFIRKYI